MSTATPQAAYIFYGEERWLLEERLKEIKNEIFGGDTAAMDFNMQELDGREIGVHALLDCLRAMPFMGERRLVIVRRPELFCLGGKAGEQQKINDQALAEYLAEPNPFTVLVIISDYLPDKKGKKYYDKFAKAAEVVNFAPLKTNEVRTWVKNYLKEHNIAMTAAALDCFLATSGKNLGVLAQELDKAAIYAGKRKLDTEDIKIIITPTAESSSFQLFNYLCRGQSVEALRAYRYLLQSGSSEYQILAFLQRQYLKLTQAKSMLQEGKSPKEIGAAVEIYFDFAIKELLNQSRFYTAAETVDILEMLLVAEYEMKSLPNPAARMERLVVDLAMFTHSAGGVRH